MEWNLKIILKLDIFLFFSLPIKNLTCHNILSLSLKEKVG